MSMRAYGLLATGIALFALGCAPAFVAPPTERTDAAPDRGADLDAGQLSPPDARTEDVVAPVDLSPVACRDGDCALPHAVAACSAGSCVVLACAAGYGDCDGASGDGCEVDLQRTVGACGACGRACAFDHGVAACERGECALAACTAGYGDCNATRADGCETDLASAPASCSACGAACDLPRAVAACAAGRCAVAACEPGYGDCDGDAANGCEEPLSSTRDCGACGRACAAGTLCAAGACVAACPAGTILCADLAVCVRDQTDPAHCGACGRACPPRAHAASTCTAGACGLACDAGFADCNGSPADGCEADLNASPASCGGCGRACALASAVATCAGGVCGIARCAPGRGDCDGDAADGCEVDLLASAAACGSCGAACALPGATAACAAGRCTVATCAPGRGDCDGDAADGCEAALDTAANCGACGRACPAGSRCAAGACVGDCPAGTTYCAATGACADLARDLANCGACGAACPPRPNAAAACGGGRCAYACAEGYGDCNGSLADGCETNLGASTAACGRCGAACALPRATAACAGGACRVAACAAGYGDCNGNPADGCEADLRASATACGACGSACALGNASAACVAGACAVAACLPGYGDCDGSAANGCETPLTASAHCGACANACAAGTVCSAGACRGVCGSSTTFCASAAACFDLASDPAHCGACATACAGGAHASAACAGGACGLTCDLGYADCRAGDGCETNIASSPLDCGACGRACALPRATAACADGSCVVGACAAGFGNCNGATGDGCETDLAASAAHCGRCGAACALPNATARCAAGACAVATCAAGFGDCNGSAADGCERALDTAASCGACGRACAAGQVCSGGSCTTLCAPGLTYCAAAGSCVGLVADVNNCGACSAACPTTAHAARSCAGGICAATCDAGYASCDGVAGNGCEVHVSADVANCGACGRACVVANATPVCANGACAVGACATYFGDCDGSAANGCEAALLSSNDNCGNCGRRCNGGKVCRSGVCRH